MHAVVAVLVAVVSSAAARAQTPDHLQCFTVKDAIRAQAYTADVNGLVPMPGCVVKVPAKVLCVAATKTNVTPPPVGAPEGAPAGRFLCYKTKCAKAALAALTAADQFGTRIVTPGVPKLLCAPLASSSTTTTTTTTSQATTTTCVSTTTSTTTTLPCSVSCSGQACRNGTTAATCVPDGSGNCVCAGPPPPCQILSSPDLFCSGGACPAGMTCTVMYFQEPGACSPRSGCGCQ
jgi:hypothetical protein